ncbi:hypothetical protein MMC18_005785 [Xylographa bjoerkii]|nr:hypothetical protein [Xylographa bjoerkii]
MINLQGVSISLTAGPGKAEFECFEPPYTQRGAEVIRAELDAPICPHINIDAGFDWHGADFLCVKACYGTDVPMKSCRIAKPAEGLGVEMDLNTWKVWDEKRFEWREASFKFCDLEVRSERCNPCIH